MPRHRPTARPAYHRNQDYTDEMIALAKRFHAKYGHLTVPRIPQYTHDEFAGLGKWIWRVRDKARSLGPEGCKKDWRLSKILHELPELVLDPQKDPREMRRLAELAYDKAYAKSWWQEFEEYRRHVANGGDPRIGSHHSSLGRWCAIQRWRRNTGRMYPWQIKALESVDFPWSLRPMLEERWHKSWMRNYRKLEEFNRKHGTPIVSKRPSSPDRKLGIWLAKQRERYAKGELPEHYAGLLAQLGVPLRRRGESD